MIERIFLWINALVIGAIGLAYLYDPNLLLGSYGLSVGSIGIDNMMRATYGGLFLGLAFLLAPGALKVAQHREALLLATLIMAGLAIGRLASLLGAGVPPSGLYGLLFYEAVVALIGGLLLFQKRPETILTD